MKPAPEELIRQMAEIEEAEGSYPDEETTDAMLESYRSQAMDEFEAERFERRLAESPRLRERLSVLARVELATPSAAVRSAALAAAPRSRVVRFERKPSARSRRLSRPWLATAAAIAATITVLVVGPWSPLRRGADKTPLPSYEATISGLAEVRSETEQAVAVATAYATTPIEISAAPLDESRSGVEIGLYRREGMQAIRVDSEPGVSIESLRGAVVFRSSADALTASQEAGTWDLYVVAAHSGDLPTSLKAPSGKSPFEALSASGRRRVEALQLIVRPSP